MLTVQHIMPLLNGAAKPVAAPTFDRATMIASPALQAGRLAVCAQCQFNDQGTCRQCCGGVPVKTLVNLTASRCGRHFWKE